MVGTSSTAPEAPVRPLPHRTSRPRVGLSTRTTAVRRPRRHRLPGVAVLLTAVLSALLPPGAHAAESGRAELNAPALPGSCDPVAGGSCLLPFPNDWYTTADPSSGTGRRVAFADGVLPRPLLGPKIDPTPWNRSDGFSPGSTLLAQVPRLDLEKTGAAPLTDIGASLAEDAPVVLLDTTTGERHPYWAESDSRPRLDARRALLVHPARNLTEGHHYAVALRNLKDSEGRMLPAPAHFATAAAEAPLPDEHPLRERQSRLTPVLEQLSAAGVEREQLHLAWDFTVAGTENLTGDLYDIRDDAFDTLGDAAPDTEVTAVEEFTAEENPRIAREVRGTVTLPGYLDEPGGPTGAVLNRGPDGRPERQPGNVQEAAFTCRIPRSAWEKPSRPALYGHGLLGGQSEVRADNVQAMAQEGGFTFCATDWIGMAEEDIPTVLGALLDLNRFPTVPERSEQGMLNTLFLGRALVHPEGLGTEPAFRTEDGRRLLAPEAELGYDGNSQGGILGGSLVAASPDIDRGVLGVTGMNYGGLLLQRSAAFDRFQPVLDTSYPDRLRQQVVLQLLQMLWDRGETNGYAGDLAASDKRVLMHVAYGDHQVANAAADVEARTLGARLVTPALADGRSPDKEPYWGVEPTGQLPYAGSGMVVWDSGTPTPPTGNTPPSDGSYGEDPHSDPRNSADARRQKAEFLKTGDIVDVCGGAPCRAEPAG